MRFTRSCALGALLVLGLSSACEQSTPTSALDPRALKPLRWSSIGTFSLQPRVSNSINDGSYGPQNTGINVDAVTAWKVRITGAITASVNYAEVPCITPGAAPNVGTYGPGNRGDALQPYITTSLGQIVYLHLTPDGSAYESDDRPADRATTVIANLTGIVGAVGCGDGTGGGSYALTGGYQIQVLNLSVPDPTIVVVTDKKLVKKGEMVVVTTTITNANSYSITGYTFTYPPGGGGLVNGIPPCVGTSPAPTQCYFIAPDAPSEDVVVTAQADGKPLSGAATVEIVQCEVFANPSGIDPVFLDAKVEYQMLDLIRQTHWDQPLANQTERGVTYIRGSDGVSRFFPNDMHNVPVGTCFAGTTIPAPAGAQTILDMHTHSNHPLGDFPNPGNCYNWDPITGGVRQLDPTGHSDGPGPSHTDLSEWLDPSAGQAPPTWPAAEIDPSGLHTWKSVNGVLVRTDSPLSACALRAGGL